MATTSEKQLLTGAQRYFRQYLKQYHDDKVGCKPFSEAISMFIFYKGLEPVHGRKSLIKWGVQYCIDNKVEFPKKKIKPTRIIKNTEIREAKILGFVKKLIENATPHELKLKTQLEKLGVAFEFQKPIIGTKSYIIDFYFETIDGKKFAIELDGPQHYTKKGMKNDKIRDMYLFRTHQIAVFRFENPTTNEELDYIVSRILASNPKPQ